MVIRKILKGLHIGATGKGTAAQGPDGFPMKLTSPHLEYHRRINEFLAEVPDFTEYYNVKPAAFAIGRAILEASPAEKILFIEAMTERRVWVHKTHPGALWTSYRILDKLGNLLHRSNPPYTDAHAIALVKIVAAQLTGTHWFDDDLPPILKICEGLKARKEMSTDLQKALQLLKDKMNPGSRWESAKRRRYRDAIDRLLSRKRDDAFDPRDAWAAAISKDLSAMKDDRREAWDDLITHARSATQSTASAKWLKEAARFLGALGEKEFKNRIAGWFSQVRPSGQTDRPETDPHLPMMERNAEVLKGLVWCCSHYGDPEVISAVSNLGQTCYHKIPWHGALSSKVGNACVFVLSRLPGLAPVAQLTRLRLKVKYSVALRLIDRALEEAATRLNMSRDELEEVAVPTYGLDETGCVREEIGPFTAELRVAGTLNTELAWSTADGLRQESVPAQVLKEFAEDLKELKRVKKDIEKMLPAQRDRIERLLLAEREWDLESWRDRYLDHPLLAHICRRLIWHFQRDAKRGEGIWHEGKMVDSKGRALDWLVPETRVRLWHPLGCEMNVVAAWRQWLEEHEVTQPFKQAHREIYVLTDAERTTGTYSNRFAAHILVQHQFAALARERGWKYSLMGAFDSHNTPTLQLPRWNLAAEFWVNSAGGNEETTQMGIFTHIATDQIRFTNPQGENLPLEEIPSLVFSEAMRDVDLFVGVCSIGNNPAWTDTGEARQFGGYWQDFAFGNLSATAKTRREVLERLLPRLKISAQCSLTDKFLVVKGSLRTYKIHLGSGNIMMEPNNKYLCIVPKSGGGPGKVLLPFEGDHTLSVILSKAFLLAEDSKIKDTSILSQIKR